MEQIKKHLRADDIQEVGHSTWYKEYFTCVQKLNEDKWTCIEGMYDRYYGLGQNEKYDYKHIEACKVPNMFKKQIFEIKNKNHTLIMDYVKKY